MFEYSSKKVRQFDQGLRAVISVRRDKNFPMWAMFVELLDLSGLNVYFSENNNFI